MSFLMKLKQKSRQSRTRSQIWQSRCLPPGSTGCSEPTPHSSRFAERMPESSVQEELKTLQETIRQDARSGNTRPSAASIFDGTRLWHEGDYRQERPCLQTLSVSVSRPDAGKGNSDTEQTPLFYRYEVRYTLSKDGAFYFNYF